ncbi:tetraspanin-4 isoform X3 [Aquila chrysaetos chrysaetos]|uniref:tetraspanin-4 isoform X3 n=1 Tax=Aquila chrysaetos chrysaetos TaxID=223781 RepID=UPI001176CA9C|nr:tetraspanin-4 isoform X3 [Aquila chrysaetos chrysaetos]
MNQGSALGLCETNCESSADRHGRGAASRDESESSTADTLGGTCVTCTLSARTEEVQHGSQLPAVYQVPNVCLQPPVLDCTFLSLQKKNLGPLNQRTCVSPRGFCHQGSLGGCGILGVGIWLAVTQGNFATLSSSFPSLSAANLLIVTGTFVMIIGFVGCIGAIKENKCLLLSFFIMLLIIFLLELAVVILFFVYTDKIDKYAQRDLKKGLHLYGTDGNIGLTNAWSIIQTDFRCCGVSNYTDWFEVYNTTRVPDSCCLEFSENCGLHSPGTWWKAPCYETVKIWLQENLLAVGIFGLCTAMVQILGLTFAMTMYCQVVKADTYCA